MALSSYDIRFILSVSDRTGNSLRRVAGDMRQAGADAARMKKAFAAMDVGRGLQLRGLLAGAGLGVAAQQAAGFATQVTKAATQIAGNNSVQKIGENTIKLQTQILDLMKQFPASAQEQADAAYDIFSSMNVPLKQGVGLLKLFNMVAVAGATDLETATNAMITILNNFGGSWDDTMKAVNTSFSIIRFGRLEFSEFNEMLNAVVPAAKQSGQSLQDVAGAMAMVTKLIPSQKQGATAISRLLEVLSRPDFRAGAKKMGLSIEDATGGLKPLPQIIGELARLDIAKAKSTINSLFSVVTSVGRGGGRGVQSTIQARRALVLLVKEYKQYVATQRNVTGATSEFEKRYTAMIGSAGVKWEKFKAQLQALLIVVGAAVIPAFEKLGGIVSNGVDWARNNKGTIEFIAKATLAVAVASLLAGTFLKLYGAGLILFTGIRNLGIVTGGLAGMWVKLTGAADAIVAALGRVLGLFVVTSGRGLTLRATMGLLTRAVWLFIGGLVMMNRTMVTSSLAMLGLGGGAGKLTRFMGLATKATALFVTALTTLNVQGMVAAARMLPLLGILSKFAKLGVITVGVNVVMNIIKKDKRDRAFMLAKKGLLGSAGLELIFGTDFGTSKWFGKKETNAAIDAWDKKQHEARQNGFNKAAKGVDSDVKKLLAQIKKALKTNSKDLFTDKMFKDLGIDPKTINDQVNALINPPPGADDTRQSQAQFLKDVVNKRKELLQQASDKLMEIYTGFRDANTEAFGTLFQGPVAQGEESELRKQWNWTSTGENILADLRAQIRNFRKWRGVLRQLVKRGAPAQLLKEIQEQGPGVMDKITPLLKKGNEGQWREFLRLWGVKNKLITQATETDFKGQMDKYAKFGKDGAFKILTGMESEEQTLQNRMNNMVNRLYSGVAQTIAEQQVKIEQAASHVEIPLPKFGVGPKIPTGGNKAQPAKPAPRHGPPPTGAGKIPFWWREDQVGMLPGRVGTIPATQVGQFNPQTGSQTVINVNGTFLTPQEMMDAALRHTARKVRNKR